MKNKTRYTVNFLSLTAYLMIYRGLWRAGFPDFYAAAVGCALLYLVTRLTREEPLLRKSTGKKMTALTFFTLLGLMYCAQELMIVLNAVLERGFNAFGLSMYTAEEVEQTRVLFKSSFADLTTLLWPIVLGPLVEELVYRSYAAKSFADAGGRCFGIVTAAVAFAIGHGRFHMCIHTVIAGMIFGYLLFEYGLKWAVGFHIINNLGIVGLDLILCSVLGTETGTLVCDVVGVLFALFGLGVCFRKRLEIGEYLRAHASPAGEYKAAFLSPGFFIFLAYSVYKCVVNLAPL